MKSPTLIGIVNITPDSFSDGGHPDPIAHAKSLVEQGADILDLGAESTRPGATPITADEEWVRLEPVLKTITTAPWRHKTRLSIDTRHSQTASRALAMGVEIINEVSGLRDVLMQELLSSTDCDIIVMHSLTIPADQKINLARESDPVAEILTWKNHITAQAAEAGIPAERLIYDPGIGFGKTPEQSLTLMLHAKTLVTSGGRWLFGHSRKSFLNLFGETPAAARDPLTLAFSTQLAAAGVPYLRVHNIAVHRALFNRLCT